MQGANSRVRFTVYSLEVSLAPARLATPQAKLASKYFLDCHVLVLVLLLPFPLKLWLIETARRTQVHALVCACLRKMMPSMFGKEKKQKELLDSLEVIFMAVAQVSIHPSIARLMLALPSQNTIQIRRNLFGRSMVSRRVTFQTPLRTRRS